MNAPDNSADLAIVARTDVTLAVCGGHAWLVRGERHIDDLLNNSLSADVTIGIVACESKSAVDALWHAFTDEPALQAWLIHPAIVDRARGVVRDLVAEFAPWSAAIDDAAEGVLRRAAAAAGPDANLVLVSPVLPPGPAAQLNALRCTLLAQQLETYGLAPARIIPEIEGADPDRITLRTRR